MESRHFLPVSGVIKDVTCVSKSRHCQCLECLRMCLCVESNHFLPVSGVFEDMTCVLSHVTASVWSV